MYRSFHQTPVKTARFEKYQTIFLSKIGPDNILTLHLNHILRYRGFHGTTFTFQYGLGTLPTYFISASSCFILLIAFNSLFYWPIVLFSVIKKKTKTKQNNLWFCVPFSPALLMPNKLFQQGVDTECWKWPSTSCNLESCMRPSKIMYIMHFFLFFSVDTLNYVHWCPACSDPSATVILKASPCFVHTARVTTAGEEAPAWTGPTKSVCACRLWQRFW